MKRTFVVDKHVTTEKVGNPTIYKVVMVSEKDRLSLHSDDKSIFTEFPKGMQFQVTLTNEQATF